MISLTLAACAQQTNGLLSLEGLGIRIAIDEDDKPPTEEALFRRKMLDALPYHAALPMRTWAALQGERLHCCWKGCLRHADYELVLGKRLDHLEA